MTYIFNSNDSFHELAKNMVNDRYWVSLFSKEDLEFGIILFKPKSQDKQKPHTSDEVYFILEGDGYLSIKGIDHQIVPGAILYVPKNTVHYFHGNSQAIKAFYALN